jgi:transposase
MGAEVSVLQLPAAVGELASGRGRREKPGRAEAMEAGAAHMERRRLWSAEQRVEIVLQSLKGQEPNTSICRRYRISEPTLYKWRNLFLEGGRLFLSSSGPSGVKALSEEIQTLKQMVVELSMAYRRLQASRSSPSAKPKGQRWPIPAEATRHR